MLSLTTEEMGTASEEQRHCLLPSTQQYLLPPPSSPLSTGQKVYFNFRRRHGGSPYHDRMLKDESERGVTGNVR